MDITIRLNGEERSVPPGMTVAALLEEVLPARARGFGVAVAVNMAVVPRADHEQRTLVAGDRVDVLHAVGGG